MPAKARVAFADAQVLATGAARDPPRGVAILECGRELDRCGGMPPANRHRHGPAWEPTPHSKTTFRTSSIWRPYNPSPSAAALHANGASLIGYPGFTPDKKKAEHPCYERCSANSTVVEMKGFEPSAPTLRT